MYSLNLTIMSGHNDGLAVELRSNRGMGHAVVDGWQFSIGRRDTCDLQVAFDTQVSRQHAHLSIIGDGVWLEDTNSRNGVYINHYKILEPSPLTIGDMFRIGLTWFQLEDFQA